jgi:outer membrane protein assembly factor BamE (lipoprotein component of BamABCDE complex)
LAFTLKQIIPVLKLDGYSGLVLQKLLDTDDSEYSKKYTPSKFLKIKNGMTVRQVYDILGEPIRADKNGTEYFCLWYSWSPKSTHYRRRNIIFTNNKVSEVQSEFYID